MLEAKASCSFGSVPSLITMATLAQAECREVCYPEKSRSVQARKKHKEKTLRDNPDVLYADYIQLNGKRIKNNFIFIHTGPSWDYCGQSSSVDCSQRSCSEPKAVGLACASLHWACLGLVWTGSSPLCPQ